MILIIFVDSPSADAGAVICVLFVVRTRREEMFVRSVIGLVCLPDRNRNNLIHKGNVVTALTLHALSELSGAAAVAVVVTSRCGCLWSFLGSAGW